MKRAYVCLRSPYTEGLRTRIYTHISVFFLRILDGASRVPIQGILAKPLKLFTHIHTHICIFLFSPLQKWRQWGQVLKTFLLGIA